MAITSQTILENRSVLMSARMRFSPVGAGIRDQALEKILEQNLAVAASSGGLSEKELDQILVFGKQGPTLRKTDVKQGLKLIREKGRLKEVSFGKTVKYLLSQEAQKDVDETIQASNGDFDKTCQLLFSKSPGGIVRNKVPFLRFLCTFFSLLGDLYVRKIANHITATDPDLKASLEKILDKIFKEEHVQDASSFRKIVHSFFEESNPLFDRIKWNMAQNYLVAKSLGIDRSAQLLSADALRHSTIFLDTNVLIAALVPESRHHGSFQELVKTCGSLDISLKLFSITGTEFTDTVNYHVEQFPKVFNLIPDNSLKKIRSFLIDSYSIAQEEPQFTIGKFLEKFKNPLEQLNSNFGIDIYRDDWFEIEAEKTATKLLAIEVEQEYLKLRNRKKSHKASTHDALVLRWLNEFSNEHEKHWFVTLDLTIPRKKAKSLGVEKLITLDALLQWTTLQSGDSADIERLAEMYSEAIRYKLLPRDTFLDLKDFQIFSEMEIETKSLPASDVEDCIKEIKRAVPSADVNKAEDREKMEREVRKFFSRPDTEFKRKLAEQEYATKKLKEDFDNEQTVMKEQVTGLKSNLNTLNKEKTDAEKLISLFLKTGAIFLSFLLMLGLITFLALKYSSGNNDFQKITSSASWFAGLILVISVLFQFFVGLKNIPVMIAWFYKK